ncbi:MAG: DUF3109 family protein [Prolixibacteraceae bacterium]|nr:DUF3109 family protein [Prolixibacteraceae bacterium]
MIQIGNAIISLDIFEEYFLCDLMSCKGACCVEGSSGAPLTDDEAIMIELHYPEYEKYLNEESKAETEKQGFSIIDKDGDLVTPLLNNRECVYSLIDESGITKCAIEKAYLEGIIPFRKPVSCHLFPIRITEYDTFDAVNYQKIDICRSGRICGKENKLPLYKFLKEPLIRKYGEEWYKEMEIAAGHLNSSK